MSHATPPKPDTVDDLSTLETSLMDTDVGASEDVMDSAENTSADAFALDTVNEDKPTSGATIDQKSLNGVAITSGMKLDVKLDDLFADDDSDEEFPSSSKQDIKASRPIDTPSSPV
jgi:DNA primase small subunit